MVRPLSRWQAALLGAVVLSGLLLTLLGLFAIGSRGWFGSDALRVQVAFPEIRGVELGTRVRIHGIDAGEVVAIERHDDEENPVRLQLLIKGEFRPEVRENMVVRIASEGMLGTKVVELRRPPRLPGSARLESPVVRDGAFLTSEPTPELSDVLEKLGKALEDNGTVGKLLRDPRAYDALVGLLESGQEAVVKSKETMTSIQRDADALKKVPLLGKYIEDPTALLVRGGHERHRRVFSETELFEAQRAVLTASGRAHLDSIAPWLEGLKHRGSEVVVVAYADPQAENPTTAREITRHQSQAVVDYLKERHATHKMGPTSLRLGWISTRKVTALGMGTAPPPQPEKQPLPKARIEVIVFVPQK
jgi:phospholipid/cholesterol/gamma-HCH transport system substrate-binding protein